MRWLHRNADELRSPPAEPEPDDSVTALNAELAALDRLINANAGKLPLAATPQARRITDTLRTAIATDSTRELDIHARVLISGMARDYLPTTINVFTGLDPATAQSVRPSGQTPVESLLDQLDTLETSALDMLTAVRNNDADSLTTQGSFLHTKFTRSDLDL